MKRQLIINLLAGQTLLFALSHCCVDSLNSAANESMGNPPEIKVNIFLENKININNIFKIQTCIMGCNKSKLNSSSCDFISDCLLNCSRFACLSQIYGNRRTQNIKNSFDKLNFFHIKLTFLTKKTNLFHKMLLHVG